MSLPQKELPKLFREEHVDAGRLRADARKLLSDFETDEFYFDDQGEWQPLSVWVTRGWEKDLVEANAPKRWHPTMKCELFKVSVLKEGHRGGQGQTAKVDLAAQMHKSGLGRLINAAMESFQITAPDPAVEVSAAPAPAVSADPSSAASATSGNPAEIDDGAESDASGSSSSSSSSSSSKAKAKKKKGKKSKKAKKASKKAKKYKAKQENNEKRGKAKAKQAQKDVAKAAKQHAREEASSKRKADQALERAQRQEQKAAQKETEKLMKLGAALKKSLQPKVASLKNAIVHPNTVHMPDHIMEGFTRSLRESEGLERTFTLIECGAELDPGYADCKALAPIINAFNTQMTALKAMTGNRQR